jgi:hypothetical protein
VTLHLMGLWTFWSSLRPHFHYFIGIDDQRSCNARQISQSWREVKGDSSREFWS